jgi:hypothetical protein
MGIYVRRQLGNGRVKFIAGGTTPGKLVVPAVAAVLSVVIIAAIFPRGLAIVALGVGAYVFYWLRRRIQQRVEEGTASFIASARELEIPGQSIPRENIQAVTWHDWATPHPTWNWPTWSDMHGTTSSAPPDQEGSALYVMTTGGESIILTQGLTAHVAAQVAADLGRTLGVPVSDSSKYY